MIGQNFKHYKIIEKLGAGGMGVVYKAEDTRLKREAAIKFIPDNISANEEVRKRFQIEAQAAASLNHPNITTIYAVEEEDNNVFIVMEYVEGEVLKNLIERSSNKPFKMEEIIAYALQIAEGLEAAHNKGIIHRDVKSGNIMITKNNKVKIMDFGLAKLADTELTKSNQTTGTLAYISPELLQGFKTDFKTDIWSFGVVLYEMLTRTLPFNGDYEAAIIYSILNEEPRSIRYFRSDIKENILSLVSSMLHKDFQKRISSMNAVIEQLSAKAAIKEVVQENGKSIAILYFENLSPDKENEYFCAGITEDLITDLSKIKELKVIPRSDVLPFRNKEINSKEIGKMLKVPFILEGSVRKAGQKIRISAQLIDVQSGYQVWAERYDRLLEDIFDIQIEVSQKITDALKVSLTENEKKLLGIKPTDDLRAYDFYLRGREFISNNGKKNNEAAIQMFEYALSIDRNFALAYAGLAEAYSYQYIWYDGDLKWLGKTIDAGEKALHLDPNLIEAKFIIGLVFYHQKRFNEAIDVFKEIIYINKDFYLAYRWMGIAYHVLGEYDSALEAQEKARAIKPYSEEPLMHIEMSYRRKGNYEEALKIEHEYLRVAERKLELNPEDAITLSRIVGVYASFESKEKAVQAAQKVLKIAPGDGLAIYNCACGYARMNMKEEALNYLKTAFDLGYKNVREWVKSDPDFDSIRNDQVFKNIVGI